MAANKKSFILYCDQIGVWDKLDDQQAGKLIKHIFKYVTDQNPPEPDFITALAFEPIKQTLKRDLKKWESLTEDRSQAGILGNLKRYNPDLYDAVNSDKMNINEAQSIAKGRKSSQSDTNVAVNVSVSDSVNVNDNVKGKDKRIKEFEKQVLSCEHDLHKDDRLDFISYWTEHGPKDKKLRFEKEKSFGLARRMTTWLNNKKKFYGEETNGAVTKTKTGVKVDLSKINYDD